MAEPTDPTVESVLRHRRPPKRIMLLLIVGALLGSLGGGYEIGIAVGRSQVDKIDASNKQRAREQINCILAIELIPEAQRQQLTPAELRQLCPTSVPDTSIDVPTTSAASADTTGTTTAPGGVTAPPATTRRSTTTTSAARPPTTPQGSPTPSPSPSPTPPPPDDLTGVIGMICALPGSSTRPLCRVETQ